MLPQQDRWERTERYTSDRDPDLDEGKTTVPLDKKEGTESVCTPTGVGKLETGQTSSRTKILHVDEQKSGLTGRVSGWSRGRGTQGQETGRCDVGTTEGCRGSRVTPVGMWDKVKRGDAPVGNVNGVGKSLTRYSLRTRCTYSVFTRDGRTLDV